MGRAIAIATLTAFYPHQSLADGFTGKDFAAWSQDSQDGYIQTSVMMAGVVLTRVQPEKSTCIDNWYFAGKQKTKRNAFIRKTIAQYDKYHPSGTILAVIEKACGKLKDS